MCPLKTEKHKKMGEVFKEKEGSEHNPQSACLLSPPCFTSQSSLSHTHTSHFILRAPKPQGNEDSAP